MKNLLTWKFWFNLRPEPMQNLPKYIIAGIIILLILLAVTTAFKKKRKGAYQKTLIKLYNFSATNAFLGLLIIFFNYETAPFFSSRFWFGLWVLGMIIWLIFIIKAAKKIPARIQELKKEAQFKKYLP